MLAEKEVRQHDAPRPPVQHDVVQLQIAMDDVAGVQLLHHLHHLVEQLERVPLAQPGDGNVPLQANALALWVLTVDDTYLEQIELVGALPAGQILRLRHARARPQLVPDHKVARLPAALPLDRRTVPRDFAIEQNIARLAAHDPPRVLAHVGRRILRTVPVARPYRGTLVRDGAIHRPLAVLDRRHLLIPHNFISYHNWADGTVAAAFADRAVPFLLTAPFEGRLGKGLEFWSPAAGAGRCCCPVGSFRQCCDESLPSWVATRLSGRLHESRSFSGPLSSPPSPTSSSPLPKINNNP
uniref:Uncharacterized protein n=1 Tax=Anopheles coluzzii TaxID=1518534 RepID=A0A8W7PZX6_ANOCL